jgi:glycine dehydrogenase
MLDYLGELSLESLIDKVVPKGIRCAGDMGLGPGLSEAELVEELERIAGLNQRYRNCLGLGYADCHTPAVIQRNILENPGWYTQYTPYQSEIAQGRLEALLNFQTAVVDLTGLEVANASLLDEATAAAEAMAMMRAVRRKKSGDRFFVAQDCHPQTIAVLADRAQARGWDLVVGRTEDFEFDASVFGALVQYPATDGGVHHYEEFVQRAHENQALVAVAADLLALTLLRPPGEWGADIAIGNTQRLGMPLGYGGPHAAYFSTRERFKRQIPGRLIGLTEDRFGKPALRMALQTREQHIRREKATSNICTAQVLPAVVASMYAVYHGPKGLKSIASRIHRFCRIVSRVWTQNKGQVRHDTFFDTLCLLCEDDKSKEILARAADKKINLGLHEDGCLIVALDETTQESDLNDLVEVLVGNRLEDNDLRVKCDGDYSGSFSDLTRRSAYLEHPVFNQYHSETEIQRYMYRLQRRDLSLTSSMIPLGSCTMKLNAAVEMMPITWPQFSGIHPYAPEEQAAGYQRVFADLEKMLQIITGFKAISLQPNAGSQGEYAGLRAIRAYLDGLGQSQRRICLIPASAHGTNPASAIVAGLEVVVVSCDKNGNIDLEDLQAKAKTHADRLAALMVTYPSTHGVFEEGIREICRIVHQYGGQVYMDGANMNAMVGLVRPADIGVDVCHLNLHKTFCIPHGGGGPGMGPIAAAAHLAPFMPRHPLKTEGCGIGPVAAAPWSSALILLISWAYIKLMGDELLRATQVAIISANYLAHRLDKAYPVLYRGSRGYVAHEAILDLRSMAEGDIKAEDVAKRLMDYGFHAPTVHFPVVGTLMVEPTESEGLAEMERFCSAMEAIREEIREIENGQISREDNPLKNAPHTADAACADQWEHPYSRRRAVFPLSYVEQDKFWPPVARLNEAQGDRNLVCTCPPIEAYT